jgi:hypothetical protein
MFDVFYFPRPCVFVCDTFPLRSGCVYDRLNGKDLLSFLRGLFRFPRVWLLRAPGYRSHTLLDPDNLLVYFLELGNEVVGHGGGR